MKFPEFEKEVLEVAAKYSCLDIVEYQDYEDQKDKNWVILPTITIKLGRFRMHINADTRWDGVVQFHFSVIHPAPKRQELTSHGMVFPRKAYPSYLPQDVNLRGFDYQTHADCEDWAEKMKLLLEIALTNRKALERDCEQSCLRDELGNAKKRWEEWRSDAKILKIENYNDGGVVQGIKQDRQGAYDSSPWCAGSNGSYRVFGDNEWIMKYMIKRVSPDFPCPLVATLSIERFMKEQLMPSQGYQRVSPQFKQRILDRLQSRELVVVTRDFGEDGFVAQGAVFLPVGFHSWDAYLEDIFKDWLQ